MATAETIDHANPTPEDQRFTWIPVRSLSERHRDRILAHLLALPADDRYLRFGHAASDEQIKRYVDTLNFGRDEIFGVFNRRLALVATAHLAYMVEDSGDHARTAEFGVSVAATHRGRGYGARLFDHAALHARNRGVDSLMIHALSENHAMLMIARKAGATLVREGSDSEAWLKLPPDSLASRMEAMVEERAAEVDYSVKRHAQQLDHLIDVITHIPAGLARAVHLNSE